MPTQNFSPALDAAQNQLGLTFSASDSLDAKALRVLGFDIAIGIFTLQSENHNPLWLLTLLLTALIVSIIFTGVVIRPRQYIGAIVDLNEHPEYFELSEDDLVLQLLADTQDAIAMNSSLNQKKSGYCATAIQVAIRKVSCVPCSGTSPRGVPNTVRTVR